MLSLTVNGVRIQGSAGAPRAEIRKMLQFSADHKIEQTIVTWRLDTQRVNESMKTVREGHMRY